MLILTVSDMSSIRKMFLSKNLHFREFLAIKFNRCIQTSILRKNGTSYHPKLEFSKYLDWIPWLKQSVPTCKEYASNFEIFFFFFYNRRVFSSFVNMDCYLNLKSFLLVKRCICASMSGFETNGLQKFGRSLPISNAEKFHHPYKLFELNDFV